MRNITCLIFALIIGLHTSVAHNDWGKTGHRAIGEIADDYLKRKTKRKIQEILGGQSLALVSTHGDDIKSDSRYDKFYNWHFVNMPFGVSYKDAKKNERGDLVTGINFCKKIITDENSSAEDKAFYLKLLVHFIGDLHQPMHVGKAEDRGGNDIRLTWFGNNTNLHSVWDSRMIDHFGMTYTELAENTAPISKEQIRNLQQGTVEDWVSDTRSFAVKVYGSAKNGDELGYRYMYDNFYLVRSQLQKGGIRLAKVLNELFG